MKKIRPDDITYLWMGKPNIIHCHPDKLDVVKELMGGDVTVEYIESDDGEHYFCSVRRSITTPPLGGNE